MDGGHGVGVGEVARIVVVGRAASGVVHPPGGFERDAVGVGEVDRADATVVDDVGDLAVSALQALLKLEKRVLVGEVEREVVELDGTRIVYAGSLGEWLGCPAGTRRRRRCTAVRT